MEKCDPYFPPTYMKDGKFTRASVYKDDILDVANEFYKATTGEFCVLEIDCKLLYSFGIPIMAQDAPESTPKKLVKCLQIYGGISTSTPNLVHKIYRLVRRSADGTFIKLVEPAHPSKTKRDKRDGTPAAIIVADGDSSKSKVGVKEERKPEQARKKSAASTTQRKGFLGRMRTGFTSREKK